MSKKSKAYKVPFKNGQPVTKHTYATDIEWRDNDPFVDSLVFTGYIRGRSSVKMTFSSVIHGYHYHMFLRDFNDAAPNMIRGMLKGIFKFKKRGRSFGIYYLEVENG